MSENDAPPLATYGIKDADQVTVYDPKTNGLKLATGAQAKTLASQGYKIGPEAEYEAVKNDRLSQVGTFLTHAGNMGSFGMFNGLLAAAGRRGDLINEEQATEANHRSAIAGDLAGTAAQMYAQGVGTPLGASASLGSKLLAGTSLAKTGQAVAAGGKLVSLAKAALSAGTIGIGQAAVQGASDEAVQDTIMKQPITAEKLAQGAFTDIIWNAAINAGVHGAIGIPKVLRNGAGNLLDNLEKMGWHQHEMIKVPVEPGTEPTLQGFTLKRKGGTSDVTTTETNVRAFDRNLRETRSKINDYDREMKETKTVVKNDDTGKHTSTGRTSVSRPGPDVDPALKSALEDTEPVTKTAAVEPKAGFEWDGHTKEEKLQVLRDMVKRHTNKVPGNLHVWDELAANEAKIKDLKEKIKNGEDVVANHKEVNRLIGEKEAAKELLSDAHPREVQPDGSVVPGFRDINDEYARVMGNTPLSDIKGPGFGVKVPNVEGAQKAKPRVGKTRINESTSTTDATTNRNTNTRWDSISQDSSQRVKQESHRIDDTIRDDRTKAKNVKTESDLHETTLRFKIPKPAPQYVKGKIKAPFDHKAAILMGGLAHYSGPLAPAFYAAAAGMESANTLAYAANYRKPLGQFFEKYGTKLAKTVALPVAAGTRAYREENKKGSVPVSYDTSHHEAASDSISFAASNPEAVHQAIQQRYPEVAKTHPETIAQVYTTVMKAVHALDQTNAKKPFAPTLQTQKFAPPRAQKVKFMKAWRLIANPEQALEDADPQTVEMLKTVFPAWHDQAVAELTHKVRNLKKPLAGRIARQISSFTQFPVRATDDAQALKRLQETAGPAPKPQAGQPQNGNPKSTGGAKSAKITTAAVSADATQIQKNEMGL